MEPKGSLPLRECWPLIPILGQLDPIHTLTSHFLKIHPNIILPSTPVSQVVSFLQTSPSKPCLRLFSPPLCATCPAHLILLYFITRTIFGEQDRSLSSSLFSSLHSPVTSSLLSTNILLSTLLSNTLNLRSSLNVSDQVSHPYKTTGKIIFACIFIFKFLDSKLENKRFCTKW